jgi:hypothetical protein
MFGRLTYMVSHANTLEVVSVTRDLRARSAKSIALTLTLVVSAKRMGLIVAFFHDGLRPWPSGIEAFLYRLHHRPVEQNARRLRSRGRGDHRLVSSVARRVRKHAIRKRR